MNASFLLFCRTLGALVALGSVLALVVGWLVGESGRPGGTRAIRSSFPQRKHYLALAFGFTFFVAYGSLVPLRFQAVTWDRAVQRFLQMSFPNPYLLHRADWVANILLFIPVGFLWLAVWLVDWPSRLRAAIAAPAVIVGCAILSCCVEFSQTWSPTRTMSHNDILAETLGGITGVVFWLVVGPSVTRWIRGYSRFATRPTRLLWWLQVYFFGLIVYSLLPLDLVVSRGEILRKFQQGKIELVPFDGWTPTFGKLRDLVLEILIWLPVGWMCIESLRNRRSGLRWYVDSVVMGMLLVVGIEGAQVLIVSRYSSITDLILGTAGVALGAAIAIGWSHRFANSPSQQAQGDRQSRPYAWFAVSVLYLPVILYMFCTPWEFVQSKEEFLKGWTTFWSAPFSSMYWGTEFNAVTVIVRDVLYFAPLGFLLGNAVGSLNLTPQRRRTAAWLMLLAIGGLAVGVELFQVILRTRVPDLTDAIFSTLGAGLGLALAAQLRGPDEVRTEVSATDTIVEVDPPPDAAPSFLGRVLVLILASGILLAAAVGLPQWILRHRA